MGNERLYIIVRSDLESLTPGKMAAQVAHAANLCQRDIDKKKNPKLTKAWKEWNGDRGFGTTIILDGKNPCQTNLIISQFEDKYLGKETFIFGSVIDPTYPLKDGSVVHTLPVETCSYMFVEDCKKVSIPLPLFSHTYKKKHNNWM